MKYLLISHILHSKTVVYFIKDILSYYKMSGLLIRIAYLSTV